MLFNSLIFLIFLAGFVFLRTILNRFSLNIRLSFLLISSLTFYGWWNINYVPILLFTASIDFFGALAIEKWRHRKKLYLTISLLSNLGVLFCFKYFNFFIEIFNDLFNEKYLLPNTINLALPIGLSFYTFQSMSYTIDVYRGRLKATTNPLLFFSFISFFPHLVAGPMVRAKEIIPQLKKIRFVTETERFHGVKLIIVGYFKKTVLADHLASFVQEAYQSKEMQIGYDYWWLAVIAFSFQIYFDFSGYSDIARGLAKNFGIHFRMNFNHPYLASSFKDFWSRWHISLSTWFRDYVYVPLGGNKKGKSRGIVNMWITMILSGIWHGANYTFIVWGAIHAFYLTVERLFVPKKTLFVGRYLKLIPILFVFLLSTVAWVFFRSDSVAQAVDVLTQLCNFNHPFENYKTDAYFNAKIFIKLAILIELLVYFQLFKKSIFKKFYNPFEVLILSILLFLILFFRGPGAQFIYFQF